jgi:predicted permease
VAVRVGAEPEEAHGELVSGNFFTALGVQPLLGRGLTAQDEASHAPVAVLSFAYWNRRFAAAPDVLGRTLYVKGIAFTIVGVAPAGFQGTDPGQPAMDFWVPLQQRPELNPFGTPPTDHTLYGSPEWLSLVLVGRLRPGVSPQQAAAQLSTPFRNALANASPAGPNEPKPELFFSSVRGVENLREEYEHPLGFLMAMVGLILLIACANVAMLLIARNASRQREFGLRQALGAGRRALFLQLLLESLVLVSAGSALGWWFAGSATQALSVWSGIGILIEPDRKVLLFTLAISAAVAILFGLAPLRAVSRVPLNVAMKSAAATSHTDPSRLWARKLVMALQISLCTVLLFAAGLLYRTLRNLESRDLGMRTNGLLVFGIEPQSGVHSDADAVRFHTALLDRMRAESIRQPSRRCASAHRPATMTAFWWTDAILCHPGRSRPCGRTWWAPPFCARSEFRCASGATSRIQTRPLPLRSLSSTRRSPTAICRAWIRSVTASGSSPKKSITSSWVWRETAAIRAWMRPTGRWHISRSRKSPAFWICSTSCTHRAIRRC